MSSSRSATSARSDACWRSATTSARAVASVPWQLPMRDALEHRAPFDVVITDLMMPDTDGHAVVRSTRKYLPQACVVVCSARAQESRSMLTDEGACFVVEKPIDYDRVSSEIVECRRRGCPHSSV